MCHHHYRTAVAKPESTINPCHVTPTWVAAAPAVRSSDAKPSPRSAAPFAPASASSSRRSAAAPRTQISTFRCRPNKALSNNDRACRETKSMTIERTGANDLLHLGRQTIKPGAQIDRLTRKKNFRARRQANHRNPRTADSSRRSACSSTLPSTRTRTPSGRSISITPARSATPKPAPRVLAALVAMRRAGSVGEQSATTPR